MMILDVIEFLFNLVTEPILALATLAILAVVLPLVITLSRRYTKQFDFVNAPDKTLQTILKFDENDLVENRLGRLSDAQLKHLKRERNGILSTAIILGIVLIIAMIYMLRTFYSYRTLDVAWISIVAAIFLLAICLFLAYHFWRGLQSYWRDIEKRQTLVLPCQMSVEATREWILFIPLQSYRCHFYYDVKGNQGSLYAPIGSLAFDQRLAIEKLDKLSGLLYISSIRGKLLSFYIIPK